MNIYLPGKSNKPIQEITSLMWTDDHEKNIELVLKKITPQTTFFAKSYGATMLLLALQKTRTKPKNIFLFGLSRKILKQNINPEKYQNISIYQNENDPEGSYEEIKKLFKTKIKKLPGNTHEYDINAFIKNLKTK